MSKSKAKGMGKVDDGMQKDVDQAVRMAKFKHELMSLLKKYNVALQVDSKIRPIFK